MNFRELLGLKTVYGEIAIGARNMERAIAWYGDVFRFVVASRANKGAEVRLAYARSYEDSPLPIVTLVATPQGQSEVAMEPHPVLFTRDVARVHADLISKGISPGPIQRDSGGNHFFQFEDSEGNRIEMCLEPGRKFPEGEL